MSLVFRHFLAILTLSLGFALMLAGTAVATGRLVADLSQKDFSITTSFHGTDLLLFGAVNGQSGDDLVVVVTGPPTDIAQRRKANRAGIWVNVETNIWKQAPSFYRILSTRPLSAIATPETLARLSVGTANIRLEITPETAAPNSPKPRRSDYIDALQSNMANLGLWPAGNGDVSLAKDALFRARIALPANILSGTYDIRVIHLRDGIAINEDQASLSVKKGGLSAQIYNLAHKYPALYGIFAIVFAVVAGWLAAAAFRRG